MTLSARSQRKGQPRPEISVQESGLPNTLQERFPSCHADCLYMPSIGLRKLSWPSTFTQSSNRGNTAVTSHSQLFTTSFCPLNEKRPRKSVKCINKTISVTFLHLLTSYFYTLHLSLTYWLADTLIASHRNHCSKYFTNTGETLKGEKK